MVGGILVLPLLAGIVAGGRPWRRGRDAASQTIEWSPDGVRHGWRASLSPGSGALTIDDIRQGDQIDGAHQRSRGAAIDEVKTSGPAWLTDRRSWAGSEMLNPINETSLPDWQISFSRDVPSNRRSRSVRVKHLSIQRLEVTD